MSEEKVINKLIETLKRQKNRYSKDELYKILIKEGYDESTVNAVMGQLYPNENKDTKTSKNDPFDLIYSQLNELKELSKIPEDKLILKKSEENVNSPEIKKSTNIPNVNKDSNENNEKITALEREINNIESELNKINEDIYLLDDGTTVDFADIPRREWRNYRDRGKPLIDIRREELRIKKRELAELKRNSEQTSTNLNTDSEQKGEHHKQRVDKLKEEVYNEIKTKHRHNLSKDDVKNITKVNIIAKEEPLTEEEIDTLSETIFDQINSQSITNNVSESKTIETVKNKDLDINKENIKRQDKNILELDFDNDKPKQKSNLDELGLDFDLDSGLENDSNELDDLNLDLDLNLEDKKKKKN